MTTSAPGFDAIVVGARVAGSAAAIMLGRHGFRVLLVDKARFPSDTLSTHIVLGAGAKVLARMGVMGMLERMGGVRFSRMRMRGPDFGFSGVLAHEAGRDERGLCLGRLRMDAVMLEAARSIDSVTVLTDFRVTELLIDGDRVAGVCGVDATGVHEYRAALTIGADGMRSLVARIGSERLSAFPRTDVPCARAYYYAYFDGVPSNILGDALVVEFGQLPGRAALACRCENGLVVAATAFDAAELHSFRRDLEGNFIAQLMDFPVLRRIAEGGKIHGRIRSSGRLLNTCRVPVCDGALLVGDAGLHVDPLLGQGHSFALISAELMARNAPQWFSCSRGEVIEAAALDEYTRLRDEELMRYYQTTVEVSASLGRSIARCLTDRAASREQWAADEVISMAQMLGPRGVFPSMRLARLIARCRGEEA